MISTKKTQFAHTHKKRNTKSTCRSAQDTAAAHRARRADSPSVPSGPAGTHTAKLVVIAPGPTLVATACTIELVVATIVQDKVIALCGVILLVLQARGGDGV